MIIAIFLTIIVLLLFFVFVKIHREGFRNPAIRRDSLYSYSYKPSRRMDKNDWRWFMYPPVAYIPHDEVNPYGWYPYGWSPYFKRYHYGFPLGPWTTI